jgi:hypothetical protein
MSNQLTEGQIASPRTSFQTMLWAGVALLFGGTLIVAGVWEQHFTYSAAGVGVVLVGVVLFFQYEQTVVDTTKRTWSRTSGGLLSKKSKTGSLDEIVAIDVHQGVDSKGYAFWEVLLDRAAGESVPWHLYTYLGKSGMERDVERLKQALGVPVEFTTDSE